MTSLLSRAESLQARLVSQGQKKAGIELARRLTEVSNVCDSAAELLKTFMGYQTELSNRQISVPPITGAISGDLKKAQSQLRRVAGLLEKPEQSETEILSVIDGKSFNSSLGTLERSRSAISKSFERALTEYRSAYLPKNIEELVPDPPGKAAARMQVQQAQRRLMESIILDFNSSNTPAVVVGGILEQIERDIDSWNDGFGVLVEEFEKQSPELQAFLVAVSDEEGASLSLLTPTMIAKLKEIDQFDEYRIFPR